MELLDSLYRIESEEESIFRLSLDAGHFIYKAHFPGKPVTPGVIIIKIAVELIERKLGRRLLLKVVKNVKFASAISPIENPEVDFKIIRLEETDGIVSVQMEVVGSDNIFAKISIQLA